MVLMPPFRKESELGSRWGGIGHDPPEAQDKHSIQPNEPVTEGNGLNLGLYRTPTRPESGLFAQVEIVTCGDSK